MKSFDGLVKTTLKELVSQAREVFTRTVIEHWRQPHNQRQMPDPDGYAIIKGPCGDTMEVFIRVNAGQVIEAAFQTDGCLTSIASGSMAVEMVTGMDVLEARAISKEDILSQLGGLPGDSEHCALLASDTVRTAVDHFLKTSRRE